MSEEHCKIGAKTITISPITRLEGYGKIEVFLNEEGNVEKAYFQVPELRGFESRVKEEELKTRPS